MKKTLLLVAVILLTMTVSAPYAQASDAGNAGGHAVNPPPVVTLVEALAMAMEDNPEIRAMHRALEGKQRAVGSARSYLLPHISIEERYSRTDNPMYAFGTKLNQERIGMADFDPATLNDPEPVDDYQTSVTVKQAIFAPEAYVGLRMAKMDARAFEHDLNRKKEEVALNVIKAYMNIITARNYLDAAERGLGDASEHHRISKARNSAGLGLYSDTLRTEVAVRQAEERRLKAAKGLNLARRVLALLIGRSSTVDVVSAEPEIDVLNVEVYLSAATEREDLKAMGKRVENAGNNVKLAGARYLPVLGVGGTWQYNSEETAFGNDAESYSVMASLRWDLYDGGKRRADRQKAIAGKKEVEEYLAGLQSQVSFKVYEAYLEMEEAEQGLDLAEARLTLAEESQRLIASRYENSLTTVVELMDTQSVLNAARAAVVEKHNNYRIAAAELMYQSGMILKVFMKDEKGGGY